MRRCAVFFLAVNTSAVAQYTRGITFSGSTWMIKKSSGLDEPGPNYFSDSSTSVWVDAAGKLHPKIARFGEHWQCTENIKTASTGFGAYLFYLDSRVDKLYPNAVLGLFTWSDAPEYNHRELDIEFSRWGDKTRVDNAQYVVQPDLPGHLIPFRQPPIRRTAQNFEWRASMVTALSVKGARPGTTRPADQIAKHTFTAGIPLPGGDNARINLWRMQGKPSQNGKSVEVVISRFEYLP